MKALIDAQMAELGLTSLSQFAKRIGVERETVSRWYNTGQLPTPGTARKVAAALGLNASDIPQFDARGVGRLDAQKAQRLESEIEELRARVDALGASLLALQEQLPTAASRRAKPRSRPRQKA